MNERTPDPPPEAAEAEGRDSEAPAGEPPAAAGLSDAEGGGFLVGLWWRLSEEPCAEAYPERIEFRDDGVYLAESADERFREWQAGDYEVAGDAVKLQMSNDAMAPFGFSFADRDHLVFTDPGGCRIEYQRLP